MSERQFAVGVVGTGNMGRHHARVYAALPDADLVGVCDADEERAADVADKYDTRAMDRDALLDAVDAVSVAVPTRHHYAVARDAVERGVHVLVEKPFVADPTRGADLVERAREAGVALQVGHVERFNPAVRELLSMADDLDVTAVDARRLGPPREGGNPDEGVVLDLMIHDLDVALALLDGEAGDVDATALRDGQHATATLGFDDPAVATLTASRVTHRKVRRLSVTAQDCRVEVDYLDQSIRIHRTSVPEYVEGERGVRHRLQSVIERPSVDSGEPLRAELSAFVDAARTGSEPPVTGVDGLRAVRLAHRVADAAGRDPSQQLGAADPEVSH